MIHFTEEQIHKVKQLCDAGHTLRDIALRLGVSSMKIKTVMKENGITTKRSRKYGTSQPKEPTEIIKESRQGFQWAYPSLSDYGLF